MNTKLITEIRNVLVGSSIRCLYGTAIFLLPTYLLTLDGHTAIVKNWLDVPALWVMIISAMIFMLTANNRLEQSGIGAISRFAKNLQIKCFNSAKASVK
jgi:hypothetical protein